MKILLVNKFHYLKGGSEKYYFELGKLLKEYGHTVAYFSMKDDKNIKTGDKEYFVEPIDLNNGSKLRAFDIIYSKANYNKMIEAIEDFKPDVIHVNNFQRQLSASIINAAYDKKIPVVYTVHDMQIICPRSDMLRNQVVCDKCVEEGIKSCVKYKCIHNSKLKSILGMLEHNYYQNKKIYDKISYFITPSSYAKNQILKGNIPKSKIEVIHNFVNKTEKLDLKYDEYFLYLGRLSTEKGIMNLLNAVNQLEDIKLKIAGDGPEKERIQDFIIKNNLQSRVELLGYLNPDEISKYLNNCKCVVLPSICRENCPYSILEAMEKGKPTIGSNLGGIPELIIDGKNGFLFQYDDINDLKEKLEIMNSKKIEKSKKLIIEEYQNKYSPDAYYKKLIIIYERLLKGSDNNVQ